MTLRLDVIVLLVVLAFGVWLLRRRRRSATPKRSPRHTSDSVAPSGYDGSGTSGDHRKSHADDGMPDSPSSPSHDGASDSGGGGGGGDGGGGGGGGGGD